MSSERDLKAEEAINRERLTLADADSKVRHFKKGWDQALQSEEVNKLREENRIMREALEFYAQALNTNNEVMGEPNPEAHLMPRRLGTFAHEALEKVK